MPSSYQTFVNAIKFRPRTYLIPSKVKTDPPLICLIGMDLSDFWCIELQNQTIPVISINSKVFLL